MLLSYLDIIYNNISSIIILALTIGVIVVILIENRNPLKAIAWITIISFIPLFGIILYIVFGQDQRRKYKIIRKFYSRIIYRPSYGYVSNNIAKNKLTREYQWLIRMIENFGNPNILNTYDIKTYTWGKDMFNDLFQDIKQAKSSIHIQSYIFENDQLFKTLVSLLEEKSIQGVQIRLIYDFIGSYSVPTKVWDRLKSLGAEVYPFMKVRIPLLSSSINYRNHRKAIIIDGDIGYVGGMNIAERYIGDSNWGIWRDTHFRIYGESVYALQSLFLTDWYTVSRKIPNYNICFPPFSCSQKKSNIPIQFISGGPITDYHDIELSLISIIMKATKSVLIETPYFLPTQSLNDAIISAALSGVKVELIIPNKGDSLITSWAVDSYLQPMIQAGVLVYKYKAGFNHSKIMMIDGKITTIGSANMDFRSFEHNFEILGIIYDEYFTKSMELIFEQDKKESILIDDKQWKKRKWIIKLRDGIIRLFSPLL